MKMLDKWKKRLGALIDLSAWMLIAPAFLILFWVDPAAAKALVQWSLFGVVMAGVAVMISRLVFPDIHLLEHVDKAKRGSLPNAIVAASVVAFVGILFIGLILWAKPS